MRAIVCGGRDYTDCERFVSAMHRVDAERGPLTVVIHGGARGADWLAHLWASSSGVARKEIVFKADWKTYGRSAGPIRNQRMIDEGQPDFVIAFPGGKGTEDMVRRAKRAGLEVVRPTSMPGLSKAP